MKRGREEKDRGRGERRERRKGKESMKVPWSQRGEKNEMLINLVENRKQNLAQMGHHVKCAST